ncbi:response regulator transcription factor [Cohnella soli]|uniref:Response regulator n=1 Tax=Cohnella soli TaxID=425005 RepID=A0ABW0HWM7_9BACL
MDDEEIIVNGVSGYLNNNHADLELYKANNAIEAIDLLQKYRMDIVITDIRMPGMTGIELQEKVLKLWPRSKVIFLTGYDDFEYVHTALRNGAVDYIMKTEGYGKILEVVQKTMQQIKEEIRNREYLNEARQKMKLARASLWKQFLLELLHKEKVSMDSIITQFVELEFPLKGEAPVTIIIGQIEHWNQNHSFSDKSLLLYAVQNISEEFLAHTASSLSVVYESSKLIWFIQPHDRECKIQSIHDSFESIQRTCREMLKIKISFAMASEYILWQDAANKFKLLRALPNYSLGSGEEFLLTEKTITSDRSADQCEDNNKDRTSEFIARIHRYIHDHISKDVTLITLGEFVYMNPTYLSRLYKQITGMNISEYINGVKVSKAKEMLKNPKFKIQEITASLGFDSHPYFTQFFKKHTGFTPQEYRSSLN